MGRGGGLMVSVLAFYFDDQSSIPDEVCNFYVKLLLKRTKINKKRPDNIQSYSIPPQDQEILNPNPSDLWAFVNRYDQFSLSKTYRSHLGILFDCDSM